MLPLSIGRKRAFCAADSRVRLPPGMERSLATGHRKEENSGRRHASRRPDGSIRDKSMAIAWLEAVRKSGQLSVFLADSVKNGPWAVVVKQALDDFNAISKRVGLGVRLVASNEPLTDTGGANVKLEAAGGSVSASWGKKAETENFSASGLHGRTFQFQRDGALEKAFVFLPKEPKINTPKGLRAVGSPVMKVIAVHELLHACGLENSDHSNDGVFEGNPNIEYGDTPARDTVIVRQGKKSWPGCLQSSSAGQPFKSSKPFGPSSRLACPSSRSTARSRTPASLPHAGGTPVASAAAARRADALAKGKGPI